MPTIQDTVNNWDIPFGVRDKFLTYLQSDAQGYKLSDSPDESFHFTSEELVSAGITRGRDRKLILAKLNKLNAAGKEQGLSKEDIRAVIREELQATGTGLSGRDHTRFSDVTVNQAFEILKSLGLEPVEVDADDDEFPLPIPPPELVQKLEDFPYHEYVNEPEAMDDFYKWLLDSFTKAGLAMGDKRDSFKLHDTHTDNQRFCTELAGRWFRGGIDFIISVYGCPYTDCFTRLRCGIECKQNKVDKEGYRVTHGQAKEPHVKDGQGQAIIAYLAAAKAADLPGEFLLADGHSFKLLRLKGNLLLIYNDLSIAQGFYATSQHLMRDPALRKRTRPEGNESILADWSNSARLLGADQKAENPLEAVADLPHLSQEAQMDAMLAVTSGMLKTYEKPLGLPMDRIM